MSLLLAAVGAGLAALLTWLVVKRTYGGANSFSNNWFVMLTCLPPSLAMHGAYQLASRWWFNPTRTLPPVGVERVCWGLLGGMSTAITIYVALVLIAYSWLDADGRAANLPFLHYVLDPSGLPELQRHAPGSKGESVPIALMAGLGFLVGFIAMFQSVGRVHWSSPFAETEFWALKKPASRTIPSWVGFLILALILGTFALYALLNGR